MHACTLCTAARRARACVRVRVRLCGCGCGRAWRVAAVAVPCHGREDASGSLGCTGPCCRWRGGPAAAAPCRRPPAPSALPAARHNRAASKSELGCERTPPAFICAHMTLAEGVAAAQLGELPLLDRLAQLVVLSSSRLRSCAPPPVPPLSAAALRSAAPPSAAHRAAPRAPQPDPSGGKVVSGLELLLQLRAASPIVAVGGREGGRTSSGRRLGQTSLAAGGANSEA